MFTPCLSLGTLFQETDLPGRFAAACELGFSAVELALPFDHPAGELAAARAASGAQVVLFTAPVGDFMSGGEGIAAVPGKQAEFRESVSVALDYALALEARFVQFVAGRCFETAGDARRLYLATYTENLRFALECFAGTGTRILVEAINTRDFPGMLLGTPRQVREITGQFHAGELGEILDTLHLAVMGVDPAQEWRENHTRYAHVQLADAPDRGPPGSGTLDFPALFRALATSDYRGCLGAEYRVDPGTAVAETLAWVDASRAAWEKLHSHGE